MGLCYTCVNTDGPKLVVEGACLSKCGAYAGGGLAPACPSAAGRFSCAYALEAPNGTVPALCFRE